MAQPAENQPRIDDPHFAHAVALIDAGDVELLRAYLVQHSRLLSARAAENGDTAGHYFARPYLLWFAAENPIRNGSLPANIVDVVRVIIATARAHRVRSLQEQIDYTLGLVASGLVPRECGVQVPLIKLLAAEGANTTGALRTALAHQEMDAAAALLDAGAQPDLSAAAGLGDSARITALFPAADPESRQRALALAALHGQSEAIAWLIRQGVDPNQHNPPGAHAHATPLHNAISSGHATAVRTLLENGADPTIPDKIYNGDAHGWAKHFNQLEIARVLEDSRGR